ncbi:mitochondrial import inner membrane translocase subunit TIM44-like [Ostrea edulis]|uniref:mitochondrial import inner membrane translocase subunit TIM44-like n=1 Tax=Ostrea edulis TaxID=37623 RepID=UPI0024AF2622|nr:mitochondrial import inner membrane translocase subunit TIM44-like [Ostrea edulis]
MSTLGHAVANVGIVCRQNCVLRLVKCQRCTIPHRQYHLWRGIHNKGLNEPLLKNPQAQLKQLQYYSENQQPKNFFQKLFDQVQDDLKKNKEIKENLKKFREERKKLEEADALLKAREKFKKVQEETKKSSTVFQKTFEDVKEKVSETVDEVSKSEFGKKSKEFTEELGKTAGKAAETIGSAGEHLAKSQPMKKVAQGVKTVSEELDELAFSRHRIYKAPEKPMKRSDFRTLVKEEREIKVDDETTGVTVHKDSKFYQSWQNFKENNAYVNKVFELKMKYDESDNPAIRVTRAVTDLIGRALGSVLTPSTLSEALTEINKYDPSFTPEGFASFCETIVVPNILEAMVRADTEVLKDWLHEAAYNVTSAILKPYIEARYKSYSQIIDIGRVDVLGGQVMEQGPVLLIQFHAHQIECWRDFKNEVVVGSPNDIFKMTYTWALCRDQEELDPKAAWKLLEFSATKTNVVI